ncbi:uncharacterized protein METZ01_LOCUS360441, partial [marine metagenome]
MDFLSRIKRYIFICLGLLFLSLGIVGFLVPGLPGTIWLIVAATFFVRSSEKLYNFVVQNKYFGQPVRDFLETGSMSIRAKVFSLGSMWIFTSISVFWAPYGWLFF